MRVSGAWSLILVAELPRAQCSADERQDWTARVVQRARQAGQRRRNARDRLRRCASSRDRARDQQEPGGTGQGVFACPSGAHARSERRRLQAPCSRKAVCIRHRRAPPATCTGPSAGLWRAPRQAARPLLGRLWAQRCQEREAGIDGAARRLGSAWRVLRNFPRVCA